MSIPNKQIGWSQESNLLWYILKQLNKLTSIIFNIKPTYKVYTALLTQSGGSNPSYTLGDELLNKGYTYTIVNLEAGDDLIPYGAPNNDVGTSFVCNQEIGNWGNPLSTLSFNSGAPVVTVLENTIGNIWFSYSDTGVYYINSDEKFIEAKTYLSGKGWVNGADENIRYNIGWQDINSLVITTTNNISLDNSLLYNTPIEIKVYS
jgi:hypothetical protein